MKTEFHRNETAGLFADARSWTDGRKWSSHEALLFIVHKQYLERKSIRESNFWAYATMADGGVGLTLHIFYV